MGKGKLHRHAPQRCDRVKGQVFKAGLVGDPARRPHNQFIRYFILRGRYAFQRNL
jgi:hypothetical protein